METTSLDASYALLNDVNARDRELQARLRNSLPLLWTTNALVMTRAAPRRRRGGGLPAEQSVDGEADQMFLALEGHASLQVSRRYKRRVEWEVARRIARVDRELQQYPPAHRFWNQKRKEKATSIRQHLKEVARTDVERDVLRGHKKDAMKRNAEVKGTEGNVKKSVRGRTPQEKRSTAVVQTGEQIAAKRVVMSSLPVREVEENGNAEPNAARVPLLQDSSPCKTSSQVDDLPTVKNVAEGRKWEESTSQKEINALDGAADVESTSPRHALITPIHGEFKNEETAVRIQSSNDFDGVEEHRETSPSHTRTSMSEQKCASSSIGRQVLSEFRTMPSVASFGAPSLLPTGGMGKPGASRLNADVLRRLFSDLDTDKDGHVNRIETCMALHRLQLSVPTSKIISFFHHIHSPHGRRARSRRTQHMPLKEVINYKEFVAFVTTAHDQQQQQKMQRRRTPMHRNIQKEKSKSSLPGPSTTLPIFAQPKSSTNATTSMRGCKPHARDEEVRVYEMDDTSSVRGAAFEDRVIEGIPDVLVSKILADTCDVTREEAKETASFVRKSLESLVGLDAIDEDLVNRITRELISERLQSATTQSQESTEDVTGLTRAFAYYNDQMLNDDDENALVGDEDSSNWADVLTEEQVSGLVQQIWKERQENLPLEKGTEARIEEIPKVHVPEAQSTQWIDEATDTCELFSAPSFSEKAVQSSEVSTQEDAMQHSTETLTPAFPTSLESEYPLRTHLARALETSLKASEHGNESHELFSPITSIELLQRLRQQRRMHQRNLHEPHSFVRENAVAYSPEPYTHNELMDKESTCSSEEEGESAASKHEPQVDQEEKRDAVPMTEFALASLNVQSGDDSASDKSSSELAKSMSVGASDVSETSDYHHMYSMQREIERHQLHGRLIPRRRRQRPQRRRRGLSASGSSVPDSICSAELSEGELSCEGSVDLSDGELFGECKRRYIKSKNKTTSSLMEVSSDDEDPASSIESGELLALPAHFISTQMKAHANYRHRVLSQSVLSSVESGEVEDGAIAS